MPSKRLARALHTGWSGAYQVTIENPNYKGIGLALVPVPQAGKLIWGFENVN